MTLSSGSELLFCAHHAREFEPRLREMDATIHDETTKLEVSPSGSADDR